MPKKCFVIMPFGQKTGGSDFWHPSDEWLGETIDFNEIYEEIIKPAVESIPGLEIACQRCDEIEVTGSIHERMIAGIADADIAVVDLTTLNANVFYELGVRHALRRQTTLMIRQQQLVDRLPFNLGNLDAVDYDPTDRDAARAKIATYIENSVAKDDHCDSQVHMVLRDIDVRTSRARPLTETTCYEAVLLDGSGKAVGLITGDIRDVEGVDVWVNSENTEMQMARFYERSVSGTIRYMGARKNDAEQVVEDIVADALTAAIEGFTCVPAGRVVPTTSGELRESNGVKWIFHAAAVTGQIGEGYKPISDITACITNALKKADSKEFRARHAVEFPGEEGPRSIVFPLLGAGQGGGDLAETANDLMTAAIAYLKQNPDSVVERVYFLAWSDRELAVCRELLRRKGDDLEALAEAACGG